MTIQGLERGNSYIKFCEGKEEEEEGKKWLRGGRGEWKRNKKALGHWIGEESIGEEKRQRGDWGWDKRYYDHDNKIGRK